MLLLLVALAFAGCTRPGERPIERSPVTDTPEPAAAPAPSDYSVSIDRPARLVAGRDLGVVVHIASPNGGVPALEDIAGSAVHLVIVNRSLSFYEHVHPRPEKDAYAATIRFPSNGDYIVHTIFQPAVDGPEEVRKEVWRIGAAAGVVARPSISLDAKRSGAYTISLRTEPSPPAANRWSSLIFHVEKGGEPFRSLIPTGTLGHMVILAEGGEDFVYAHSTDGEALSGVRAKAHVRATPPGLDRSHSHGGDTGPDVTFHTHFPHPGRYKAWVEFSAGGETIDADFAFDVGEPRAAVPADQH